MIRFVHKKHIHKDEHIKAWVIYYSLFDIILGSLLIALVVFFIYNYLEFSFQTPDTNYSVINQAVSALSRQQK